MRLNFYQKKKLTSLIFEEFQYQFLKQSIGMKLYIKKWSDQSMYFHIDTGFKMCYYFTTLFVISFIFNAYLMHICKKYT